MPTDFHGLFAALEAHKLRYVVVGGLALVLHGVDRLTADIDLAVDLAPEAAASLITTPWDTTGTRPTIDLFTESVIPFEDLWREAVTIEIVRGLTIRVASIPHLIQLKQIAGRPQDLTDIERLSAILAHKSES